MWQCSPYCTPTCLSIDCLVVVLLLWSCTKTLATWIHIAFVLFVCHLPDNFLARSWIYDLSVIMSCHPSKRLWVCVVVRRRVAGCQVRKMSHHWQVLCAVSLQGLTTLFSSRLHVAPQQSTANVACLMSKRSTDPMVWQILVIGPVFVRFSLCLCTFKHFFWHKFPVGIRWRRG